MSQQPTLTEADLRQFTGTENYYQHWLGITYTDGVQFMAEQGGAYWLIDAIASWQAEPVVRNDSGLQELQFWRLEVNDDDSAVLICDREEGDEALRQEIPFTDFPLKSITLYLQGDVLMLPSEH